MNIQKQILPLILILCGFFTPHAYAMHEGNENLQPGHAVARNSTTIEYEADESENAFWRLFDLSMEGVTLCSFYYFSIKSFSQLEYRDMPINGLLVSIFLLASYYAVRNHYPSFVNTYNDGFERDVVFNFRRIFYPKKLKIHLRGNIDDVQDGHGSTLLMQSGSLYFDDIYDVLTNGHDLDVELVDNIIKSRANFSLALLKAGANVNSRNYTGKTALMSSVLGRIRYIEKVKEVRSLLIAGADVFAIDNLQRTIFEKITAEETRYGAMPAIERDQNQGNFTDLQMIKELCKNPQLAFDSATQQEKEMFKARFPDRPFKYVPASLDEALLLYNRFDNRQALLTYLRETYDIFKAFADTKGDDKNVSPEFRVGTPLANEIFSNLDPERTEKLKAALEKADKCGHRELVTCLKAHGASYSRAEPTEWTSFNDELHAYDTVLPAVPVHVKERSVMNCQKME